MRYAVIIEEGEDSFGAYVPDLPGCVAVGETKEEVLKLIEEAIEFHIEGLREDAQPIPEPSSSIEYVGTHATYEILGDTSGRWWWRLVAANGRVIATSSEHYKTKAECLEAIELVKSSSVAPVKAA
ncbi:MAG TPA: type II toxin-antitoxin system HicB family antitoxin [Pyrinomonadaceae bacterium]|jgi:predicted RNase H-like HicB family nuclease|nr:type II toxin-antitoxin system HicB family antitoxin [Pyrinomonadaceae bacterium]